MNPVERESSDRFFARLRVCAEEARELRRGISDVRQSDGDTKRRREIQLNRVFTDNVPRISHELDSARAVLSADARLDENWADAVTRVENHFTTFCSHFDRLNPYDEQYRELNSMILELNYLLIPLRVNENLRSLRVGQMMNVFESFSDEDTEENLRIILSWMSAHPRSISGIVDSSTGMVRSASSNPFMRAMTFVLVGIAVVVVLVLVGLLPWASRVVPFDLPARLQDNRTLLVGLFLAYVGSVAHVGLAALKTRRPGSSAAELDMFSNFALWVHVRQTTLLVYSLLIPIVSIFIYYVSPTPLTVSAFFFVGYSVDSFLDTFVDRFTGVAAKRTEVLAKSLKD